MLPGRPGSCSSVSATAPDGLDQHAKKASLRGKHPPNLVQGSAPVGSSIATNRWRRRIRWRAVWSISLPRASLPWPVYHLL